MEKTVKYKGTDGLYKMITRKDFHKLVKRWRAINEANRIIKAVEDS